MERATNPQAIIVAHGSPSFPKAQERVIAALAARVETLLPDLRVRGATLAAPGALNTRMDEIDHPKPLIYPFFIAPGWFTDVCLPERLESRVVRQLPPLGVDSALPELIAVEVEKKLADQGLVAQDTALLIAAHGSPGHPESGDAVRQFSDTLSERLRPRSLHIGFIEEPPLLADAARIQTPAICVPFFAIKAGHVVHDVPEALAQAKYNGLTLPPLIDYPHIDRFVANALRRAAGQQP